ncbi:hypothetical protein OH77DRAFT_1375134, partial [Trametes cingulata]
VLGAVGAVVSGSTALHILDIQGSARWVPNDLDIYTPLGKAVRLVSYLVKAEYYQYTGCHLSNYHGDFGGYTKVFHLEKSGRKIDVIQSCTASALHPIPYFWSTHVMNYLTADSFCIAYPTFTLSGRGLLNPLPLIKHRYPRERTLSVMAKYQDRGYDFRLYPYA